MGQRHHVECRHDDIGDAPVTTTQQLLTDIVNEYNRHTTAQFNAIRDGFANRMDAIAVTGGNCAALLSKALSDQTTAENSADTEEGLVTTQWGVVDTMKQAVIDKTKLLEDPGGLDDQVAALPGGGTTPEETAMIAVLNYYSLAVPPK